MKLSAHRDLFCSRREMFRPCQLPACAHRSRLKVWRDRIVAAVKRELVDWRCKLVFFGAVAALVAEAILGMRR